MNLKNLESLKAEMKKLGFDEKLSKEMEQKIEKGIAEFTLHDKSPATKGQVEMTLFFKKSKQSEFYYFNKFEVVHNQAKALEEGYKFMVITPQEKGKNLIKNFDNAPEAIAFFKEQKGDSELSVGKEPEHRTSLAKMENGKVAFVASDFKRSFYGQFPSQTFFVEKGKGFTAQQAANLIQGRSVYRNDLMNLKGVAYKAWIKLDFDKPKDRYQNFTTNQYHDPSYGFDIKKVLDRFEVKELQSASQRKKIEESLKNGNRPMVTVLKDGVDTKLFMEAVPRYSQINMYRENGRPEKREQFMKEMAPGKTQSKGKNLQKEENQGMAR